MDLTPKQSDAIKARGSVAVTAGAGTGKTAMLAARFVHHVVMDGFSPLEIAAVTFTEKAAAELRARIRRELAKSIGEERAAETDAAQISTIHSLAARICRDFYDLAGIPADFRLLDETDAELVLAAWFDEAMASLPTDVVTILGYSWLRSALQVLYKDPPAAATALEHGIDEWRKQIDEQCRRTLDDLKRSECWVFAKKILSQYHGAADDKLETVRVNVVNAMADIEAGRNIPAAFDAFEGFRSNGGSAKNWPAGIVEIRGCLKDLREAFRNCREIATLEIGEADVELSARLEYLRRAFAGMLEFIQSAKLDRGVLDFADLEHYAIKILEHSEARDHYSERWKAILVDEFQDTNPVQEKLLKLLADSGARLTIVGDGKQSIYGFRRADPRVFERFRREIENDVILDRTFRTHRQLVSNLNAIFQHVLGNAHQSLEAERADAPHDGPFVEAHSFDDDAEIAHLRRIEGKFIAGEIGRIITNELLVWDKASGAHRSVRPSDIAILSRTRAPLDVYIEELIEAGIPAVNTGGGDLLDTQVAKDVSVLLRFCSDPGDDIALAALLRGPFFAVDDVTLYELSRKKGEKESWWQLVKRERPTLQRPVEVLSELIECAGRYSSERLIEIADELTGYTAVIANLPQSNRRMADWFGCLELIRRFARLGRSDVVGADRYLKDLKRAGSSIPRPPLDAGNAVSLMTIHAAKGLEWPIVFVPNLSADKRRDSSLVKFDAELGLAFKVTRRLADGKFVCEEPALLKLISEKKKSGDDLESKRVLYVAMTRSRDRLYLTSAGKEKEDLVTLMPGLQAAGIEIDRHDANYTTPPFSTSFINAHNADHRQQLMAIEPRFSNIPVTGLVEYSICPKRFKFRYVDGHPGLAEGALTDARTIGSLTHTALELDIDLIDDLSPISDGASDESIEKAIDLARVFRDGEDFSSFRLGKIQREVSLNLLINGVVLSGVADLVGDDWVLDFKTDSEMAPEGHAIQLWTYARALNKKRAVIAYLRHNVAYELTQDELEKAEHLALSSVKGIVSGLFNGKPSSSVCGDCEYSVICSEREN
jgi:ATP-dependent helicase/nuclease subunit A